MTKKSNIEQLADIAAIERALETFGKGNLTVCAPESPNSNGAAIVGATKRALRRVGWPENTVDIIVQHMTAGNYENLLNVAKHVCHCFKQEITFTEI